MAAPRHLSRAPIVEALIDIRVELPESFSFDQIESLSKSHLQRFPKLRRLLRATTRMSVERGTLQSENTSEPAGLRLESADGLEVVQFRRDGFTFNRLPPYSSWDEVFPGAFELWRGYEAALQPVAVTRLALRYINVLRLPEPKTDLSEFLKAPPVIPEGVPRTCRGFLTQLALHDEDSGISANLTQSLQASTEPGHVKILLDIDVYKLGPFDEEKEKETTFENLHRMKNQIFFNSITEKTAELLA